MLSTYEEMMNHKLVRTAFSVVKNHINEVINKISCNSTNILL